MAVKTDTTISKEIREEAYALAGTWALRLGIDKKALVKPLRSLMNRYYIRGYDNGTVDSGSMISDRRAYELFTGRKHGE